MFVSSFLNWNLTQNKTLARREPIYTYSLNVYRKIQEKNSELVDEKKWIKQQKKKKLTIKIKKLLWEFNLYRKFMCTEENNNKNKENLHPAATPVTVFLIAGTLLCHYYVYDSINFQTVNMFLLTVLWKIERNFTFVGGG